MSVFDYTQLQVQSASVCIPIPLAHRRLFIIPLCSSSRLGPSTLLATDSSANKDNLHGGECCRRCEAVDSFGLSDDREDDAEEKGKGHNCGHAGELTLHKVQSKDRHGGKERRKDSADSVHGCC
jgi:hypothetical protein